MVASMKGPCKWRYRAVSKGCCCATDAVAVLAEPLWMLQHLQLHVLLGHIVHDTHHNEEQGASDHAAELAELHIAVTCGLATAAGAAGVSRTSRATRRRQEPVAQRRVACTEDMGANAL